MTQERSMDGKVVVVTGGGRGLGRAISLMMAQHGAAVVVNDFGVSLRGDAEGDNPADEVVAEIKAAGGEAVANFDTVAEWDAAHNIIDTAIKAFGRIDCVVNNAGILRDKIFFKMTPEDWDAVIKVHLYGAFNVSRAAADHFKEQESGAIVSMTSNSGLVGNFGQANYSAAKLGIVALSKSMALDLKRFNVRSNCISPFAWSRMIGSIPNTPEQEQRIARARELTPEKVAPLAIFLGSDAARDVTGQIFTVRGNEVFLMSQPRPMRSIHRSEGWTPKSLAEHMLPALRPSFVPLDVSADVFCWDAP
ncbi:SDR family NAD(P)-dependent oxidoreductase [Rhodoligotrophos appendicifer]|uniref:SDR family NAD(P)-dependent oxidoreductase n=1 Tax=Rhodoligotrophos appendicifer TaxID=987056 RepID=UPI0011862CAA|nr:SDR family NAD(P)-dependent oxidoreductase [Rhodoligotrophos appendicifer]